MTQEEELLLKDLCGRLAYHPNFHNPVSGAIMELYNINTYAGVVDCMPPIKIEDCRLYLRPMSSMTEEERTEVEDLNMNPFSGSVTDWLNKKMFDYRGLIPMGLALEAPEGMYK